MVAVFVLACFLFAQVLSPSTALAFEPEINDIEEQIRQIDRQVLLELVELDRFNIRYRLQVNHYARWRQIFYPAAQEANAALITASGIVSIRQSERGWNKLNLISETALRKGINTGAVGCLIGGGSSAVELLADSMQTWKEHKQGYSPVQAVAFEKCKVERISKLISERDALMHSGTFAGDHREYIELKGQMCRYIRDRLVFEFKQWNYRARAYAWYKNTFYVLNAITNFSRFSGFQAGLKGLKDSSFNGAAGPILTSASAIAAVTPAVSLGVGYLVRNHQVKILDRELGVSNVVSNEEMELHYERLLRLVATSGAADERVKELLADIELLRTDTIGLDATIHRETRKIVETRRVAAQQAIAGPIVGTLGMASSTVSTIGYYGYRHQPKIANRMGLPSGLLIIGSGAIALYQTPKSVISGMIYEHALRVKGEHPDQLLEKRLVDLDEIEAAIKAASK